MLAPQLNEKRNRPIKAKRAKPVRFFLALYFSLDGRLLVTDIWKLRVRNQFKFLKKSRLVLFLYYNKKSSYAACNVLRKSPDPTVISFFFSF